MSIKYLLYFFLFNISFIYSIQLKDNDFFTEDAYYLVKKINRFAMSKSNKEYMHVLIEKLKKYIFSRDIERAELPKSKYNNIREIKNNFQKVGDDGTFDLYSHERIDKPTGYQVSFETEYDSYSNEEYEEIIYKLSLMSDNHCYIGVYANNPEISFYFEDYELANTIGILFNQISIWNWRKSREILNKFCGEYI